jgi:hypothetical protein
MVISAFWLAITAISILAWLLVSVATIVLMFGDDRAFWIGPSVATITVATFWCYWFGLIVVR